ncbi:DUF5683 domain-containing protein [Zobellia nedashkovskayae]
MEDKEVDSLQTNLAEEGLIVVDTLVKQKVVINPLAPSKAAFYSAVFPGLGQIYNKRYWKVPIVYGAIGAAVYGYTWNNNQYQRVRTAFKRRQAGFTDDEFYDILGDDRSTERTRKFSKPTRFTLTSLHCTLRSKYCGRQCRCTFKTI